MPPSLLAVFAHPDDESLASGGLLARCADEGVRVSLLCLTRGEHGPGTDADRLGEVRAGELRAAADILGVEDVTLLEHEDGMLPWIDAGRLEQDILEVIRRVGPSVAVTFDEDGLYGHPDHVAVHERTTAVVATLGARGPALLYASMPRGAMRALVASATAGPAAALGGGAEGGPQGDRRTEVLGIADPDAFGAMAPKPTLVLDLGRFATLKLRALRCHRTQVAGGPFDAVQEQDAPRLLGTEHYRRAPVGARGPTFVDAWGTGTPQPRAG